MPANLPPQYQKAEEAYRQAHSPQEQIECLELMFKLIPKHKGTEKLQADLKTRLKETRAEFEAEKQAPKKGRSYRIPRQGAGQVLVLGGPNAGKSRVLAELTSAQPQVADFPFTTHEPAPGMMPWEDVQVQLIDTPPITAAHLEPYLVGMVRSANAVILCLNGASDDGPQEAADVVTQLADRKTLLSDRTGFGDDDMSVVRIKTLLAVTRGSDPDVNTRLDLFRELVPTSFETFCVDFDNSQSSEELRNRIFAFLEVIRIYTKKPGKPAELKDPFTIPTGGTVEDVAGRVHRDLPEQLKHARIWGQSAHDGQTVSRDHVLFDKDVVELHA